MKLFYSKGACSLSPHIALHEAGLPHQAVLASTKTHQLEDGTDYYTINPLGYVPFLVLDDGRTLSEGPVIVQYIADQAPEKKLMPPAGSFERYQVQAWLNLIGTELHKGAFSLLFNPATPDAFKDAVKTRLGGRLQFVDQALKGKAYLMGEQYTVADIYLFVVTNWAGVMKIDLGPYPHLQAWRSTVAARPAVQAALKVEGFL